MREGSRAHFWLVSTLPVLVPPLALPVCAGRVPPARNGRRSFLRGSSMSIGHIKAFSDKTDAQLYGMLGQGDTPKLYAIKHNFDYLHDVPYSAGISIMGDVIFVDRELYREVMSGRVSVRGMTAKQIIQAWGDHEKTEWAIEMGDNPCDSYQPAHEYATHKEDRYVEKLPVNPDRYEETIKPALVRCRDRFIRMGSKRVNPPKNLWCGPVLDHPDIYDKKIIRILQACGVQDAFKISKPEVHYGIGEDECIDCAMFQRHKQGPFPALKPCTLVDGLVRDTRHCDRWTPRKGQGKGNGNGK
jgi:hypothetical protein